MHDTGCLGLVHWDYPRIEPTSLMSHALAGGFFATSVPPVPPGKPWAGLRVSETSNECCVARGKEALSLSLSLFLSVKGMECIPRGGGKEGERTENKTLF